MENYLCPWSTEEEPFDGYENGEEKNLFNVRKTKALPAGYTEPVLDGEELVVQKKPSSLVKNNEWSVSTDTTPSDIFKKVKKFSSHGKKKFFGHNFVKESPCCKNVRILRKLYIVYCLSCECILNSLKMQVKDWT